MSTKAEIIEKLKELGIEHDEGATKAELEALLPEGGGGDEDGGTTKTESGIEVGEPLDLRPKSLPLVIKLPASASSAQREYARILNGYAYQNRDKWNVKKTTLLAQLECLADYELPELVNDGEAKPNQTLELNTRGIKGIGTPYTFTFVKNKDGSITPYSFPVALIRKDN